MMTKPIAVPPLTAGRLREWVRTKEEIEGLINATVLTLREALAVPDDWQIRSIDDGFVAPVTGPKPDPEANGQVAEPFHREAVG
jgi:hypothetical protein